MENIQKIVVWIIAIVFISPLGAVEDEACNNKYKNLVILQNILQNDPYAKVPPFLEISSERNEAYVNKKNSALFALYRYGILRLQAPKDFLAILKTNASVYYFIMRHPLLFNTYRRQSIEQLFRYIIIDIEDQYNLFGIFPFSTHEEEFFNKVAQNNHYLMVRSSGLEDSATTANAGLYKSIAYVKPDPSFISGAIGEVIASYFNLQAIKNNLTAGLDLFSMKLCIPVLIQELIGEPFEGTSNAEDIPISGVAFTTNSALSTDTFAITEINTAYGHGEGVVASKVPVDRFYVVPSRATNDITIYPMIVSIRQRLVPSENAADRLILMKNPDEYILKPTLTNEQIKRLYTVLKKIEKAYDRPMDVEFVIKNDVIYIVQTRPAMRHELLPSYIPEKNIEEQDRSEVIEPTVIIPGSSDVRIITDPGDIIIAETLDQADADVRRTTAKAVIVETWASPLSHAAVNFMAVGTPCLYVHDMSVLKKMVTDISAENPLVIDVQRRAIYTWNNSQKDVSSLIEKGWYEHPIQRALSLTEVDTYRSVHDTAIVPQDATLISLMEQLKQALGTPEQSALFTEIQNRVSDRLKLTEKRITNLKTLCDDACKAIFNQFNNQIKTLLNNYKEVLDQKAERFELLFYHKMLEALLYQEPNGNLNTYTYRWFLDDLYNKQQIYGKVTGNVLLKYGEFAPSKSLLTQWKTFAQEVTAIKSEQVEQTIKKLIDLLDHLAKIDGLYLWFATNFYQLMQSNSDNPQSAEDHLNQLAQLNTPSTIEQIAIVENIQSALDTINTVKKQPIATLQDAQNVWNLSMQLLINPLTQADFFTQVQQMPQVMKMIVCKELRLVIDNIDEIIKLIKSNAHIPLHDRKSLFMTMLEGFFKVSKAWLLEIMPEESLQYNSAWSLRRYINRQQSILNDMIQFLSEQKYPIVDVSYFFNIPSYSVKWIPFDSYDAAKDIFFQKSQAFSVQAAMLGTGTAFDRHYPATPEDMFMLIHQNSLMAISATFMSLFKDKPLEESIYLPLLVRDIADYIKNRSNFVLIGLEYTADTITLIYNIPLNNHSGGSRIMYDIHTQEVTARVEYLGEARERWQLVALFAAVSPELSNLQLKDKIIFDEKGGLVTWDWKIDTLDTIKTIVYYIEIMNDMSFFGNSFRHFWRNIQNKFQKTQKEVVDAFTAALPHMQTRIRGELKGNWEDDIKKNF